MRTIRLLTILALFVLPTIVSAGDVEREPVTVYFNEACSDCKPYVDDTLLPALETAGYTDVTVKDYVNDRSARKEYVRRNDALGIPLDLQSHLAAFVADRLVLGGHLESDLLDELLTRNDLPEPLVVFQDEMPEMKRSEKPLTTTLWSPQKGEQEYVGDVALDAYLAQSNLDKPIDTNRPLLPIVLSSGFLDGLNPCAFAVLLFFITFLFAVQRSRGQVLVAGLLFTFAIFLAYLGIGLGLWRAIIISERPHLLAEIAAWLVVGLGVVSLLGVLFPRFPIKLRIPAFAKPEIQKWVHRTTLPAAFVAGFLVGLCTFPCSGGIYVAIVGLLAAKTTAAVGLSYLLLYNVMFVLPLLIILGLTANRFAAEKIKSWQQKSAKTVRVAMSASMVALGLIILIFFT